MALVQTSGVHANRVAGQLRICVLRFMCSTDNHLGGYLTIFMTEKQQAQKNKQQAQKNDQDLFRITPKHEI